MSAPSSLCGVQLRCFEMTAFQSINMTQLFISLSTLVCETAVNPCKIFHWANCTGKVEEEGSEVKSSSATQKIQGQPRLHQTAFKPKCFSELYSFSPKGEDSNSDFSLHVKESEGLLDDTLDAHGQDLFSRPLKVLMSYAHTVSIPSPVVWSGVQCGKGNRQAITLASSSSSSSSFFSSCDICGEQQSSGSLNSNKGDNFKMPFCTSKSLEILKHITSGTNSYEAIYQHKKTH